ncbi:hypothetical protein SDC9_157665 [bioreactor metagenome]
MTNVQIGDNVIIEKSIIGSNAIINNNCHVGDSKSIEVIGAYQYLLDESAIDFKEICLDRKVINL